MAGLLIAFGLGVMLVNKVYRIRMMRSVNAKHARVGRHAR